mmetsp:Transcript_12754/g.38139  ORF Transcript_12754/g.38139 Transcript_12754/m.38139 type:complete len:239 (-) Transcript_12754:254-970(-)
MREVSSVLISCLPVSLPVKRQAPNSRLSSVNSGNGSVSSLPLSATPRRTLHRAAKSAHSLLWRNSSPSMVRIISNTPLLLPSKPYLGNIRDWTVRQSCWRSCLKDALPFSCSSSIAFRRLRKAGRWKPSNNSRCSAKPSCNVSFWPPPEAATTFDSWAFGPILPSSQVVRSGTQGPPSHPPHMGYSQSATALISTMRSPMRMEKKVRRSTLYLPAKFSKRGTRCMMMVAVWRSCLHST